jgi:hypothetical protein
VQRRLQLSVCFSWGYELVIVPMQLRGLVFTAFTVLLLHLVVMLLIVLRLETNPSPIRISNNKTKSYSPNCSRQNAINRTFTALCALAKYEDAYIQEYIDYYTALGFCGFYFYDNSDEFTLRNVITNTSTNSDNPLITLIHYPGYPGNYYVQVESYHDCVERAQRDSFTWAAFYDLDEFLVLKKHTDITTFIQDHGYAGGIVVHWIIFGSSNQTVYKPIPVSKRFQYRDRRAHHNVKSILRLSYGPYFYNPHNAHFFTINTSSYSVDTSGKIIPGPADRDRPTDVALIHHFRIKSQQEYVNRRKHGRADQFCNGTVSEECPDVNKIFLDKMNDPSWIGTVFDDSVWQVLKRSYPDRYERFDLL